MKAIWYDIIQLEAKEPVNYADWAKEYMQYLCAMGTGEEVNFEVMSSDIKKQEVTCAACGIKFVSECSAEDALQEFHQEFGANASTENLVILCDDCYNSLMTQKHN